MRAAPALSLALAVVLPFSLQAQKAPIVPSPSEAPIMNQPVRFPPPPPGPQPVHPVAQPQPTVEPTMTTTAPTEVAEFDFDAPAVDETSAAIGAAIDSLAAQFDPGDLSEFNAFLAQAPDGMTGGAVGQILYSHRHFARAAWFFGQDALADPSNASAQNNFAGLLQVVHETNPSIADESWLTAIELAARSSAATDPGNAAAWNTLANALRLLGQYEEAVAAAERAVEIASAETLYWTNLARALDAAGHHDRAGRALSRAHALEANALPVRLSVSELRDAFTSYQTAQSNSCNINFNCQAQCPPSIIGQINYVTCEIENQSAQLACAEGRPHATSFDCREQLPEYGILIPGLNAGFSVMAPGVTIHFLFDNDGTIRTRGEVFGGFDRLGLYARGDGTYDPRNGFSFSNIGAGARVNILPRGLGGNTETDRLVGEWGHPPAHLELEQIFDGTPAVVNLETYNFGWISL